MAQALSEYHAALAAGLAAAPPFRLQRPAVALLLGTKVTDAEIDAVLEAVSHQRELLAKPEALPVSARLELLRSELSQRGLAAFLVPHDDEFMLEYTPAYAGRLEWLTNFNGSAGMSVVLSEKALFVSDGRYKVKAAKLIDPSLFEVLISDRVTDTAVQWLVSNIKPGDRVGYDPQLINLNRLQIYQTAVTAAGGELVACSENLVDLVWENQPARPISMVTGSLYEVAGHRWFEKVRDVAESLKENKLGAAVITDPASVAWLFNIRGNDVACTPLPLSRAIVYDSGRSVLFVDPRNVTIMLHMHLDGGRIEDLEQFPRYLEALGESKRHVLLDPGTSNSAVFAVLEKSGATVELGDDPCALPRARKTEYELKCTRAAHIRDGAAICRMLAWFDREAGKGTLTEMDVVRRLIEERLKDKNYYSESFTTIVASGPNSRDIHYFPTEESDRAIGLGDCVLMDTGAQYLDGTTDSTRVKVVGFASGEIRRNYTLVLKGNIALASQRFPVGCSGARLDTVARMPLWNAGLNFDHGTGHGVGVFLSVHEGPQRIGYKLGDCPLDEGMILSDEPGSYDFGDHGIRLENLLVVGKASDIEGGMRKMHSFEVLTMIPFDCTLIDERLLSKQEIVWLNGYHAMVRRNIEPLLEGADRDWLIEATQPIALRGSSEAVD
ncbi:MAG: aminopeptidase P family protein [Candidatus Melainabacteria bacterium]|nr:MAG: aminopeptidase P family protein [Candidatus Melainabacteria bacterium]